MYKSQKRKNTLLSRGILLILAIAIIFMTRAVWNVYTKERLTRDRLEEVGQKYQELSDRNNFLESEIERLSTDAGVEEEIRKQYGLAREGERVFVIVDREEEVATTTDKGFWQSLFGWGD